MTLQVGIVTTNDFPQCWPRTNPVKLLRSSMEYKHMVEPSRQYNMSSPSGGAQSWLMTYLQKWEGRESVKCQWYNRGLSRFGCTVEYHLWCWHSGFQNCCCTKITFRGCRCLRKWQVCIWPFYKYLVFHHETTTILIDDYMSLLRKTLIGSYLPCMSWIHSKIS